MRAIGQGFKVSLNPAPQTFPFNIVEGLKVTASGNFRFGFINALVDSHGTPTATSEGAVEYDIPAVSGYGEALGTTFGVSVSDAANDLFSGYRSYSALAVGIDVAQ